MCITNVADILTPSGLKDLMKRVMQTQTILKTWTTKQKTANINGQDRLLSPLKNQREQKRTCFPPTTTFGILNLTPKARKKLFGLYY